MQSQAEAGRLARGGWFPAIQRVLGAIIGFSAVLSLPSLLIAAALDEPVLPFASSLLASATVGFALWWPARRASYELRLRDGFLVVTATWSLVSASAALPFVIGAPHLDLTDALFESTSGLTTTGATVIVGLDALPRSLLFYRQALNFLGGMGIVIFAVAILPMLRIGGTQLFVAESTGHAKDTRLTPRIADTAKALWKMYFGLNVLCALAYWLAGMSAFDAICHAMATLATGGFSTHDASFGYWDSALIDGMGTLFMAVGGVSFALHYLAWRRATSRVYQLDAELRAYVAFVVAAVLAVAMLLWAGGSFASFGTALRHAAFQTVSNVTTTGFTTTGFVGWFGPAPLLLLLLGFVGGCAGSTTGGLKVARMLTALRYAVRELRQLIHPRGTFVVNLGGRAVPERLMASIFGFLALYAISFLVLFVLLAQTGLDAITAFSAAVTSITNLGPGLGSVASNFAGMNDVGVWLCTFAMILGRLEVMAVLVIFTPAFWAE